MTGTNFSSWYRADEGTVYADVTNSPAVPAIAMPYGIIGSGTSFEMRVGNNSSGNVPTFVVSDGTQQANINLTFVNGGTPYKSASCYKVNDFQHAVNGTLGAADTLGTVPVVTSLTIGARGNSTSLLNGTIKKLAYYPKRLTNAELQGLTTV
jgi:hypothetical protein